MMDNTMDTTTAGSISTEENTYYVGWSDCKCTIQLHAKNEIGHRSRPNSLSSVLSSISQDDEEEPLNTTINNTKECCICYEMIDANKNNCITPCGHSFCFVCIVKSMQVRNTCPCCRQPFWDESRATVPTVPTILQPPLRRRRTIPMIVEREDEEIAESDWFMEASTTYTQDDGGHDFEQGPPVSASASEYDEYDEWPPATAVSHGNLSGPMLHSGPHLVHEMMMLQHTLDPFDRRDFSQIMVRDAYRDAYEVMNQNLSSMNVSIDDDDTRDNLMTTAADTSTVFPDLFDQDTTMTPPRTQCVNAITVGP